MSPPAVEFGNIAVGSQAVSKVSVTNGGTASVQISQLEVSGSGFSVTAPGTFPFSLAPGSSYSFTAQFSPNAAGSAVGQVAFTASAAGANSSSYAIALTGTGTAAPPSPALASLTCSTPSITGAGSDTCTFTLTTAAGSGGLQVTLSSNSAAVAVPASVQVPSGATSASFEGTVSAVTSNQTAVVTATAGTSTQSYTLTLNAIASKLSLSATSVAFGNVTVNTQSTSSVTLTSSGTAPLTVSNGSVSGTGFSMLGVTFPSTLNPGQTASLSIAFEPKTTGTVSGAVTLTSNSANGPTATISLSGTGQAQLYTVNLAWDPPSSSADPVAGYDVYRAAAGSSNYQLLNSSPVVNAAYTDSGVKRGASYTYYVESVDAKGSRSVPSNSSTLTVP